jgi:hypothetical protein
MAPKRQLLAVLIMHALSRGREVIAVDLQGHARTADIPGDSARLSEIRRENWPFVRPRTVYRLRCSVRPKKRDDVTSKGMECGQTWLVELEPLRSSRLGDQHVISS